MGEMVAGTVESPRDGLACGCIEKISKPETCGFSAVDATEVIAIAETRQRVDAILASGAAKDCTNFKDSFCRAVVAGRFTRACCAINEIDPLLTQEEWHGLMDLINAKSGLSAQ